MIEASPYPQEEKRLASLQALNLLDMPIEERFERITRMVCKFLDVPIAIFNLVDRDRQHYKSVRGINAIDAPKPAAFCTHALLEDHMLLVPDARKDERFFDNPFVTGDLNLSFYAGCPVHAPDGMPIGTLCAIDTKPRNMSDEQLALLHDLAAIIETEIKAGNSSKVQEKLKEQIKEARHMAMVDPLTRLWNRAGIEVLLQSETEDAARRNKPVTIVMSDIDHFKRINDNFGHPVGDIVLQDVSKRILESLRSGDDAGRVGGEEFLMVLPGCPQQKARETVERIRRTIEARPVDIGETRHGTAIIKQRYPVTMSFGAVTIFPGEKADLEAAIKKADDALYKAKREGRNRVVLA